MTRVLFLAAAVVACAGFASTASARPAFRDTVVKSSAPRSLQATTEWGGPTVATDGETVTIFFSSTIPADPALAKQWADFMTSLVHGPELQTVTIHLGTTSEVAARCGAQALACYFPGTASIFADATDPEVDVSAKGVLIHEYGHHIAASRLNPPFTTIDYGPKRWASYENVCAQTQAGDLYPGAEDQRHYMLNPGEAFAESYRVLNEQLLGLPLESWDIVTPTLYPDATALGLIQQDVTTPWTANTTQSFVAKLSSKVRSRTFTVSTPYDGTLSILPRQSAGAKVSVSLLAKGSTVATRSFSRTSGASVKTTVCGARSYNVRVKLAAPVAKTSRTTVSLAVSTP